MKHILLFGVFGALTTALNVAAYHVCSRLPGIGNVLSTVIAWFLAVTFAFFTNKAFVFDSRSWERQTILGECLRFFGCRIGTGCVEVGLMVVFVDLLGLNGTVMKLVANMVVIVLNYLFGRLYIFGIKDRSCPHV